MRDASFAVIREIGRWDISRTAFRLSSLVREILVRQREEVGQVLARGAVVVGRRRHRASRVRRVRSKALTSWLFKRETQLSSFFFSRRHFRARFLSAARERRESGASESEREAPRGA